MATKSRAGTPVLEARDVVRTYAGPVPVRALRGIAIALHRGEFVALMGPSGSGKSTLLGLLAGFDSPDEGQVLWKGKDMARLTAKERATLWRGQLAMVFQSFGLLPSFSARENVEWPLRVAGASAAEAKDAALRWLARVGLQDRADHRTFELSIGQQQRVALARALVIEPDIVLADEPIAEVDSESADVILSALEEVALRGGAVVAAAHNAAALTYASWVVLLRDGSVESAGTPDELSSLLLI